MTTMPSKARQGLDQFLRERPLAEVVHVDHQGYREAYAEQHGLKDDTTIITMGSGPWTQVTIRTEQGHFVEYAIWNETGNVYETDQHGAVADDPFIWITPFDTSHVNVEITTEDFARARRIEGALIDDGDEDD